MGCCCGKKTESTNPPAPSGVWQALPTPSVPPSPAGAEVGQAQTVTHYELRIISAQGLRAADRVSRDSLRQMKFSGQASSDPYVVVLGKSGGIEYARTDVVHKNCSPEWDHCTLLSIYPSTPLVFTLQVLDHDQIGADDRLGKCEINVADLAAAGEVTNIPLGSDDGHKAQGSIAVRARRVPPKELREAGGAGLRVLIGRGHNVPKMDVVGESDAYVAVGVVGGAAPVRSRTCRSARNPVWNSTVSLGDAAGWDLDQTRLHFVLYDEDMGDLGGLAHSEYIGEATVPLRDLLRRPAISLLVSDRDGNAVLGSVPPHMPCEIDVAVIEESCPSGWPPPEVRRCARADHPRHVVMITRGTRGDVQPFVALARGMALQRGWMVSICTELRWKPFVEKNAAVERGRIRFLPAGGDTEKRVNGRVAQWAMGTTSEVMQTAMLAMAEAEFFGSGPVLVHHLLRAQRSEVPPDLLVFGFTTIGIGLLASERCGVPAAGFILQPSCIPSSDPTWKAVVAIDSWRPSLGVIDKIEEDHFTGHGGLQKMKDRAESMGKHSLPSMRKHFGLREAKTWDLVRRCDVPLIIPMNPVAFDPPPDWSSSTQLTQFIFLRGGGGGGGRLSDELESFIDAARAAERKLILMTFSSMPVKREAMLECATRMVTGCKYPMSLIYVGVRQPDKVSKKLLEQAGELTQQGRLIELTGADFGVLFQKVDAFVIHGGLGTTVEALRTGRPCCVTGPLLMDQRFWGGVVQAKGAGPAPQHISRFKDHCVDFCEGALSPDDPHEWQARGSAMKEQWGAGDDDGTAGNVAAFERLLDGGLQPVRSDAADQPLPPP